MLACRWWPYKVTTRQTQRKMPDGLWALGPRWAQMGGWVAPTQSAHSAVPAPRRGKEERVHTIASDTTLHTTPECVCVCVCPYIRTCCHLYAVCMYIHTECLCACCSSGCLRAGVCACSHTHSPTLKVTNITRDSSLCVKLQIFQPEISFQVVCTSTSVYICLERSRPNIWNQWWIPALTWSVY